MTDDRDAGRRGPGAGRGPHRNPQQPGRPPAAGGPLVSRTALAELTGYTSAAIWRCEDGRPKPRNDADTTTTEAEQAAPVEQHEQATEADN
ncbi:hypothetical protein ACGFIK_22070 [Micromonospora sp. NPDC048871]|uniref:hypothetical protein n=1 Tax=unclassified Micromonospora TaxID=2617518 RepID=UPI002E13BB04|nr:hypothetical protein OIE53_20215 [Micromonospora sp. NBC_01739]